MEIVKDKKCKKCGCTQDSSCIDKRGNPCYWQEDDLCSGCKTFPFTSYKPQWRKGKQIKNMKAHNYIKVEADLTVAEQDILYRNLVTQWDNNTARNRNKLILEISKRTGNV